VDAVPDEEPIEFGNIWSAGGFEAAESSCPPPLPSTTDTVSGVTVIRGVCSGTSPTSWGSFSAVSVTTGLKGAGEGDAGAVASVDSESVVSNDHG